MLDTLIIGSGSSGIGMAVALLKAGRPQFEIWERASALGGTWRDNHYPGAACDVASPVYSYSFAPKPDWSSLFPKQPEILDYIRGVARDFGVEPHLRFNRKLVRAEWQSDRWRVEAEDGTVAEARFLVLATGALSNPRLPNIDGCDAFQGAMWHSADWNHGFDLSGKHVAVIGTGASAIQFVPEIAPQVASLTVFQRTPPWVVLKMDRNIPAEEAERYRHQPWRQKLYRLFLYLRNETLAPRLNRMRGLEMFEDVGRQMIAASIADPNLREKLTPGYRLGCKRLLISNHWYPTLARDNVALVTEQIAAITPDGIRTADGEGRRFDAIIFGTGFAPDQGWKGPEIRGLGLLLRDHWGDRPRAHCGITVSGFPNLFITMGPATGLGHNSAIYMIEAQIAHIMSAMRLADRTQVKAVMPTRAAEDAFVAEVQRRMADTVWVRGGCESWYLLGGRENYTLWPGHSFSYRRRVKKARARDYQAVDAGTPPGH